jgi:hypothetical protein
MKKKIPKPLKRGFSLFIALLIPTYWIQYGPQNFLWFSDVNLFLVYLGVMTERKLLASMAAVGGIFLELLWIVSILSGIALENPFLNIAGYMFDPAIPVWIRILSLFHVALPPLLLWLILRLGYDRRAWLVQTALAWLVLALTRLLTDPSRNINLAFGDKMLSVSGVTYMFIEAVCVVLIFWITHRFLIWFTSRTKN